MALLALLTVFCAVASACAQTLPQPGPVAAGGAEGAASGGEPFPQVAQQGDWGGPFGAQLGNPYAHLDAEVEGRDNQDIKGHIHIYVFRVDNATFNLLYVFTVKRVPQQTAPSNATVTSSQDNSVVLYIPAMWREMTGQPGFKQEGDMMDSQSGMYYSYAAAGYWPSVNPTLADLITRMVDDPGSYQGHVTLPSGEDVRGQFELAM